MPTLSAGTMQFAFSLYSAVAAEQRGNFVISPLPFSLAFSLLLNGADPETQQELLRVTGLTGNTIDEINRQNQRLQKILDQLNQAGGQKFALASSLWASLPLAFSPPFLDVGGRFYSAEIASVPRAELPDRVSRWSLEKTNGLIDMRLQESDFALLTATYFKGAWKSPFSEEASKLEDFHPVGAPARKVPMMQQRGEFSYFSTSDFHVVALPYATATMYVLAPKPDGFFSKYSLAKIEQRALTDGWIMTQPFAMLPGLVKIPKFKLRYDGDFIPVLRKLGVIRLFDSFDSLRPAVAHPEGAKVTEVLQNSTITVDEKGAEAASALAMGMRAGAAPGWKPPKPFEFIADRPFCFWIMDDATNSVLFSGRVMELP